MRPLAEIEAEVRAQAEADGYMLNPDGEITQGIIEGLAVNEERLGYWRCPCRLSSGDRVQDLDIICPCQYRDDDLRDYGRCYCALYVTQGYLDAGSPTEPIPERRPNPKARPVEPEPVEMEDRGPGEVKVWRCTVCGYLCARNGPPPICPICRAQKDKFEEFRFEGA